MYKKILAAVNEYLNSEVSARYALQLAKALKARLYLCTVAEKDMTGKSLERARAAVKRLQQRAAESGVASECIFDAGDPVSKIREVVHTEKIDLVFASTRREDVKKRLYTGTVARRLSVGLPCSVALVRVVHMGRVPPKEILVPLKARVTRIAERAYFAAMLARAFDSSIYLFHITKPIKRFLHGEMHLTPVEWEKKVPPDISRFIDQLDTHGVAHEKRLAPGTAGKTIAIEAAVRRSDLIIMGESTRSLVSSLLRGNPVERALRETPCNLIILKPGHEDQ